MTFGKVLTVVLFSIMFLTAWLSSSQGWMWYSMRSPTVMKEYKQDNAAYDSTRRTGAFRSSSLMARRSSFATTGSHRSFRSGTRGGRGK